MADHSIWVVEYGYIDRFPASNLFAAQPNEGHRRMPYCFGVVRSAERVILVDTGFFDPGMHERLAAKYGEGNVWADPVDVVGRCDVAPDDVDVVVLTHAHFDHAGRVPGFPRAHVVIQAHELEALRAAEARGPRFEFLARSSQKDLADHLAQRPDGTVTLADGPLEVSEGVSVLPAHDTHTAGSQVVVVANQADGPWVFAGDNMYSYENVEGLHFDGVLAPIAMSTGSPARWIDFIDETLTLVGGDVNRILPFHESRVWERFRSVQHADGLHVAEVSLAGGHDSVLTR